MLEKHIPIRFIVFQMVKYAFIPSGIFRLFIEKIQCEISLFLTGMAFLQKAYFLSLIANTILQPRIKVAIRPLAKVKIQCFFYVEEFTFSI